MLEEVEAVVGRFNVAAQLVGCLEYLSLEAEVAAVLDCVVLCNVLISARLLD